MLRRVAGNTPNADSCLQLQVRKTAPRLDVLRELLSAVPYSGAEEDEERIETARHALNRHHATDEMEDGDVDPAAAESATEMTPSADDTYDPDTAHLTWGALVERIQASETELLAGLRDLGALEINGRWRVLAVEYFERVLDLVLALCVEKDWPISKVPASVCVEELDHLPGDVVRHCVASQGVMDGDGVCAFEPEKIALFRAKQLFRASKGRVRTFWQATNHPRRPLHLTHAIDGAAAPAQDWELRQFQRAWAESLPEHWEVPTPMSLLANEVLLESMGSQTALKPFSVSDLPASAAPRFAALFAARPAWTMEDLEPFVRDLVASGDGVADLMLKHCRSTLLPDGTREYTAR